MLFRFSPHALWVGIVALLFGRAVLAACAAGCSSYCGQAALNEYYYGTGSDNSFIEAVVPTTAGIPQSTYEQWTVKVMGGASSTLTAASSCTWGSRTFVAATFAPNALDKPTGSSDVTVLLLDENSKIVDMLVASTKAGPTANTSGYSACSSVNDTASATTKPSYLAHTIVLDSDAGTKGYARSPDFSLNNTGKWYPETGTGAGTNSTKCSPNSGLALAKTVVAPTPAPLLPGDTVRYQVTLTNQSTTTGNSGIPVTDTLDAGLSYVSGSAVPSSGTTYVDPTWTITSLPAQGSASLQLDALVSCSVIPEAVRNNTVSVATRDLFGNAITATDVAPVTVKAFDHIDLSYSGTPGCSAVPVTVTACRNAACTQTYGKCSVPVTLSPAAAWSSTALTVTGVGNASIPPLSLGTSYTLGAVPSVYATVGATTCNGNVGNCTFTTPATCPTASAFDAYETAVTDANAATPSNRILKTRMAGGSSLCTAGGTCAITVAAFDAANAVATAFGGTLTASLEYCTSVSRGGSGMTCAGWADVPGVAAQTATITSGGKTTVTFPAAGNAYEMVRVKLVSGAVGGGPWTSTDRFAIRPQRLVVTAKDKDWATAGGDRLLDGSVTHKAGRPFTLFATGEGTAGSPTAGYAAATGSGPLVSLVSVTNPPSGGSAGTLEPYVAPAAWTAVANGLASSTATYSEVGEIAVTLEDRSFADVDSADSSAAERYFSGTAALGRFVPDHFLSEVTPACGSFTYSDQPFVLKVTARNMATGITLNYAGGLARTLTLSDAVGGAAGTFSPATIADTLFSAGVATVSAQKYRFTSVTTVPATVGVRVTEPALADGVSSADPGGSEGGLAVRSGRLWLANAYGSELLPLPVPMQTQYWSLTGWTLNAADSCTSLVPPTVANSGLTNTLASKTTASLSAPVVGGLAAFRLSAPGQNNAGVVDITGSVVRGGNTWLLLSAPTARACFGVCGPRSPVIYQRERY